MQESGLGIPLQSNKINAALQMLVSHADTYVHR